MNLSTAEPGHGGFIVKRTQSGTIPIPVHFYGYTGNVGVFRPHTLHGVLNLHLCSGSREDRPFVGRSFFVQEIEIYCNLVP